MSFGFRPIALSLALATLLGSGAPALAQDSQFLIGRVNAYTPDCQYNPGLRYRGSVSGQIGRGSNRSVAVTGCFASIAECERWANKASGEFGGRIIAKTCGPRRR